MCFLKYSQKTDVLIHTLEATLQGGSTLSGTRRWIHKNGKVVRCEGVYVPIYKDGNLVAVEGISREVPDRK